MLKKKIKKKIILALAPVVLIGTFVLIIVCALVTLDFFGTNETDGYVEENEVYAQRPDRFQLRYIDSVVTGVANREDELDDVIRQFSIGWDISRISKLARCILRLAIYEILYVDDVPTGVAVAEAVRIAKKYDGDDTGAFINGILGSFVRSRNTETEAPQEEAK